MLVDHDCPSPGQHPDVSINVNLKTTHAVVYHQWHGPKKISAAARYGIGRNDLKSNKAHGLSGKAQKRIRHYVQLLTETAKTQHIYSKDLGRHFRFKLNFITLTLSSKQTHTDSEIYKGIFKPFLRILREKLPGLLYIWKAEVQDNGNLHFHLTGNKFIHHRRLRNIWNYCQDKFGYINRSRNADPNSTDVHAIKNIKDLPAYLSKYLTKGDSYSKILFRYHRRFAKRLKANTDPVFHLPKNYFKRLKRKVTIKLWDCSKALKIGSCRIKNFNAEIDYELKSLMNDEKNVIRGEHATIILYGKDGLRQTKGLKAVWLSFLQELDDLASIKSYLD